MYVENKYVIMYSALILIVVHTLLSFRHPLERPFYAWRFILNENVLFWLTISYQKLFVVFFFCFFFFFCFLLLFFFCFLFHFCGLISNTRIYSKIKLMTKNWSDLCNFYSKMIFWNFDKVFLLFFAKFELLMFHNNIVKISKKLDKEKLLKICLQVTYPTDFCIICDHFYYGKKRNYLIFIIQ